MPSSARKPCLAAAAFFAALGLLIAKFALAPLGAADLLGISACAAASGSFATLAFALRPSPVKAEPQSGLRPADLEQIAALLDARLASAEEKRRAEIRAAVVATTPPRELDADAIPAPVAGAKPRLGRGLLGLMQSPSALANAAAKSPTAPASSPSEIEDDRAAA